jgi:O-antigen/teichoic acid export membrane protein
MSRIETSSSGTLRHCLVVVFCLTVGAAAGIMSLAPTLPGLLGWSPDYLPVVPLIMILAWQQPLVGINMVLGTALVALHREKKWLWVAVVGATLSPLLNVLFIPIFETRLQNGALAAAVVEVVTEVVMLVGAISLLPRRTLEMGMIFLAVRVLFAGAGLVAVMFALIGYSLPLAVIVSSLSFAALLVLLRVIRVAELRSGARNVMVTLRTSTLARAFPGAT